jgi:hypothetical protein
MTGELREKQERFTKDVERGLTKITRKIKDSVNNYDEELAENDEPVVGSNQRVENDAEIDGRTKTKLKKFIPFFKKKTEEASKARTMESETKIDVEEDNKEEFYDNWKKGSKFASVIKQVL